MAFLKRPQIDADSCYSATTTHKQTPLHNTRTPWPSRRRSRPSVSARRPSGLTRSCARRHHELVPHLPDPPGAAGRREPCRRRHPDHAIVLLHFLVPLGQSSACGHMVHLPLHSQAASLVNLLSLSLFPGCVSTTGSASKARCVRASSTSTTWRPAAKAASSGHPSRTPTSASWSVVHSSVYLNFCPILTCLKGCSST